MELPKRIDLLETPKNALPFAHLPTLDVVSPVLVLI